MFRGPFLALTLCLLSTCLLHCDYRKFDEGPVFSIYPTEERLANTWKWQLAVRDGEPLTGQYADSTITFMSDASLQICDQEGQCRDGSWNLVSKRTRLQLIFGEETELFDIQMLKRDEIWLRTAFLDTGVVEWELITETE